MFGGLKINNRESPFSVSSEFLENFRARSF